MTQSSSSPLPTFVKNPGKKLNFADLGDAADPDEAEVSCSSDPFYDALDALDAPEITSVDPPLPSSVGSLPLSSRHFL